MVNYWKLRHRSLAFLNRLCKKLILHTLIIYLERSSFRPFIKENIYDSFINRRLFGLDLTYLFIFSIYGIEILRKKLKLKFSILSAKKDGGANALQSFFEQTTS